MRLNSRQVGAPRPSLLSLLFVALLTVLSTTARAQDAQTGEVIIYVFDLDGLPVDGVRVRQEGATVGVTDAEGTVTLILREGRISLSFQKDGYPTQPTPLIPVVAGRSTEIIVTYTRRGGTFDPTQAVDVEAPSGEGLSTGTATVTGRVEGQVTNENGNPVADAQIFVRGSAVRGRSDEAGRFVLEDVPAGKVDLTVIHPEGEPTTKSVEVLADDTIIAGIMLRPKAGFSQEFVVTIPKLEGGAVFVLAERRESSSVADLLGADQIQKSGDSDAASALQRVTGITLVGGRYVYVRGLGERYSTTLLDGSTLPSPDPEKRVVPLDLFPASILGSIVVQKTYSPDLPGEFGGGTVNLRTRSVPDELEIKVSASVRYRTESTFDTALGYDGSDTDFLSFGQNGRAPTDFFREALDRGAFRGENFSDEELQRLGLEQNLDFGLRSQTVPLDVGLGASLGGSFDLFGAKTGALVGVTYGNSWWAAESEYNVTSNRGTGDDRTLVVRVPLRLVDLYNDVNLGGIGVASVEINEQNKVLLTTSLNRIAEYSARLQYGFTNENETRLNRLRWVEQQLLTSQLRGEHTDMFGIPLRMDWRYMFSTATRDEPDRREVAYAVEAEEAGFAVIRGPYQLDDGDILNQRFFSFLNDINHDIGVDFTLAIPVIGDVETKFKAGFAAVLKSREVEARRFTYVEDRGEFSLLPPDLIFSQQSLSGDNPAYRISETTEENDSYEASQDVYATYAMTDFGILENLRILAGARIEASNQRVETFLPGGISTGNISELSTLDVLPAITLTWEFIQDMQLRAAASQTLSRPNFRELSPSRFRDLGGTVQYSGNPDLERTKIVNLDLRYEWYPSPGESFSTSLFYKSFENPVEQTGQAGATDLFSPSNVTSAFNLGAEIETRVEFGFIDDFLADLYFAGNLTLVFSEVVIPEELQQILTTSVRPLALQSPWVVNAQVGYDNPEVGISASVLYNIFGARIWAVGTQNRTDFYEQPFDQLDFVASWKFDRFKLQFKANNLMDPLYRITQERIAEGDEIIVQQFRRGRRFQIGLGVDLD